MNKSYAWAIGLLVIVVGFYLITKSLQNKDSKLYDWIPKDTSNEFKEGVQY